MTRRQLAFMKQRDDGDNLVRLNVKDGMVLDTETAIARLQVINRKSDVWMPAQGFEAFFETAHVKRRLARSELAASIDSDF